MKFDLELQVIILKTFILVFLFVFKVTDEWGRELHGLDLHDNGNRKIVCCGLIHATCKYSTYILPFCTILTVWSSE